MATIVPDVGLELLADKAIGEKGTEKISEVAIGDGTTDPTAGDTSMQSELYRSNVSNSNCSVSETSDVGQLEASISVSGGTEIPSGSSVTELGVFTDAGTLMYREVRTAITISSGERVTFKITIDVTSA